MRQRGWGDGCLFRHGGRFRLQRSATCMQHCDRVAGHHVKRTDLRVLPPSGAACLFRSCPAPAISFPPRIFSERLLDIGTQIGYTALNGTV